MRQSSCGCMVVIAVAVVQYHSLLRPLQPQVVAAHDRCAPVFAGALGADDKQLGLGLSVRLEVAHSPVDASAGLRGGCRLTTDHRKQRQQTT